MQVIQTVDLSLLEPALEYLRQVFLAPKSPLPMVVYVRSQPVRCAVHVWG